MYCYTCDTRNPEGAHFCVICGKPLTDATAKPAPAQPAFRPTSYAAPSQVPFQPGLAAAGTNNTVIQHIYVNQSQPQLLLGQPGVNLLVRAIWFLFIGLWLGHLWLLTAWLLNLTVVGLPLGVWMLNRMPQVMTLRPQPAYMLGATQQNNAPAVMQRPDQAHFAVRAIYFIAIGWWLSFLWLQLAWIVAATVIGLPLAFLMFERTETVTTLG